MVKPTAKTLHNLPLPNLEDPKDRITAERLVHPGHEAWEKQPMPAGFGWFPKAAAPRHCLAA